MNKHEVQQEIQAVWLGTQRGELKFPEVVGRLLAAGVESYVVDFAAGRKTCYFTGGRTQDEPFTLPLGPVAADFDHAALVAAIRGAQADTVRYPEFVQRSLGAGVIGYWAFLTGKQVLYLGRKGEQHLEKFPQ